MHSPLRVLMIEDSAEDAERMRQELVRAGLPVKTQRVQDAAGAEAALAQLGWDLVLTAYALPDFGALALLELLRRRELDLPVLVVSGAIGDEAVVELMRAGARDVILKQNLARLGAAVARQLQEVAARRLAAIVRCAGDAICSTDLEGIICFWNPAAERLFGWSAAEAVGRPITLIVPAERRAEREAAMADIGAGRQVKLHETERMAKDGRRLQLSLTISPILGDDGRLIGASVIARDVTAQSGLERERQQQAETLRQSEQWHRLLLDSIPQMVWMADEAGHCVYLNPRGVECLGLDGGGVDGVEWLQRVHPDEAAACRRFWHEVVGSGQRFYHECRLRHAGGQYRWVLAQGERLPRAGETGRWIGTLTDIDDLKRAEAGKRRDALLLANVRDAVIVTDLEGVVTYWNEAATRLFGWTAEELVGRPLVERVPPDARPAMAEQIRHIAAGGSWAGDYQDWRKDGASIWIDARVSRIHDAQGRPLGVMGLSHDITDRKRAEAERDQLLSQLRLQIERMPLGYMLFGADDRIVDWNPAAEAIFGYARVEMIGHGPPFEKIVPATGWHLVERAFAQARCGHLEPSRARANRTKDGRRITCDWYSVPLISEGGEYLGMFSLAQDITERRRAEEMLHLLERAIQATTQGILISDVGDRDHPHIIYASPGMLRLTGYSADEIIGQRAAMLAGRGADPTVAPEIVRAIREGRPATVEMFTYRKDGTGYWDEISLSPILDASGNLTHFVGVHTDITKRRELEQQYLHAQKMEAVGRLAGGIAHDFNNLLTVINGYAELLVTRSRPGDPNWKAFNQIKAAGERSAALTRQLLTFSRQEVVRPSVFDLNAAIANMESMLRPLLGEEIKFRCQLMPGACPIKADPGHIEQVVMNLAVNARDAMPRGGTLTLTTASRTFGDSLKMPRAERAPANGPVDEGPRRAAVEYVELTVRDTGAGMSPEVKARIFEPFFTTKGRTTGTGLGLSMVDGILKQSGGFVEVESEPGQGAAFHMFWPRAQTAAPLAAATSPTPAATGNEIVLLVEDDDGARGLAQLVLEEAGYRVLVANGGEQALRMAGEEPETIHLLVTDVVMPGMGGRVVAERLLQQRPQIKVLYISGYTDDEVVRHGVQHAQVNFLSKPFSPVALAAKVRQVLDAPAQPRAARGGAG